MIHVTEFVKNLITGDVAFTYIDPYKGIEVCHDLCDYKTMHFNSEDSAKITLKKIKRDAFIKDLVNLIVHCDKIYEASRFEYKTKAKEEAFDLARRLKNWIKTDGQNTPLNQVCQHIIQVQEILEKILPNHHNPSYNTSRHSYFQIIEFAKENQ